MLRDRVSFLVRVNMLTEVKVLKPVKPFTMDWGQSHIKTKGGLKL